MSILLFNGLILPGLQWLTATMAGKAEKITLSGIKSKIFDRLLKIASYHFSYLLKVMINLLSLSIYITKFLKIEKNQLA